MRTALIVLAAWALVSPLAGVIVGLFIRAGRGPDPTPPHWVNEGSRR